MENASHVVVLGSWGYILVGSVESDLMGRFTLDGLWVRDVMHHVLYTRCCQCILQAIGEVLENNTARKLGILGLESRALMTYSSPYIDEDGGFRIPSFSLLLNRVHG